MTHALQLDFFETTEESILRELARTSQAQDTLRRSLFARHGDLMKLYALQQEEIMQLKRFVIEKCGANLMDLTPCYDTKKVHRKSKVDKKQLTFAGI